MNVFNEEDLMDPDLYQDLSQHSSRGKGNNSEEIFGLDVNSEELHKLFD